MLTLSKLLSYSVTLITSRASCDAKHTISVCVPCNGNPLLLSSRHLSATLADQCVQPFWQFVNKVKGIGFFASFFYVFVWRFEVAEPYVFSNCEVKQNRFLAWSKKGQRMNSSADFAHLQHQCDHGANQCSVLWCCFHPPRLNQTLDHRTSG